LRKKKKKWLFIFKKKKKKREKERNEHALANFPNSFLSTDVNRPTFSSGVHSGSRTYGASCACLTYEAVNWRTVLILDG